MLRNPRALVNLRALNHALADLIEHRKNKILLSADRKLLDRMITDLQAEMRVRGIAFEAPATQEAN
jgi:hypothetical protein